MKKEEPLRVPFTVVVDTREQEPYSFEGIRASGGRLLSVPIAYGALASGDYSVLGGEHLVAVERKSAADLYSTLGQGRKRFEREHRRLSQLEYAAVVVEASWQQLLTDRPKYSRLAPKSVLGTAIAWGMRYGVHWIPAEDRRLGEIITFRILQRWWWDAQERSAREETACRNCGRPLEARRSRLRGLGPTCREGSCST